MGLSNSTTKTDNSPWAPAQPYIIKGLEQTGQVFDQTQPDLNKYAGMQRDSYNQLAPGAEYGVRSAQKVVNRNLSGANLNGNPYIDGIIGKTDESVTNQVNDQFGPAGRFGSGYHAKILGDSLASAENQLRYGNYATERGYQQDAIGQAQSLMGGSQSLLNNAADLPYVGVGALNGNIRQASNGYGVQNTSQQGALIDKLIQMGSNAAQAAAASDPALKTNIERVGTLPDGLGVYDFDYIDAPNAEIAALMPEGRQRGVMADEVAALRPWALGPVTGGYATVLYSEL